MFRCSRRAWVSILISSTLAVSTFARADTGSLNGEPLTVTLEEEPYDPLIDTITAGPGGPQIVGNDASDPIGSYLFHTESVDAQDLKIVYTIAGGGGAYPGSAPQCSGSPGCTLWGPTADNARFLFSDLNFGSPGIILDAVTLTTTDVFGVQLANVMDNSFEVIFGSAGILNQTGGNPDVGTITLDLHTEVAPVPLPSSLVMLLGGSLLMVWVGHRRRPYPTSIRS